ncbi:MAG TPA: hypothetical protein VNA24_19315 [Hyalangium sp.]|nr:hypothetical protein [Hyalangium sp.]
MKKLAWTLLLVAAAVSPAAGAGPRETASAQGPKSGKKPAAPQPLPPKAPEPTPRPPFRWDVPGLIAWVDSAGTQISDGVPLSLQLARSKLSVQTLLQHFVDSFEKAGFFIPPGNEQLQVFREPQITALDTAKLIAYTVIFQENPDGTVTLILGTSNLSQYKPGQTLSLTWAPLPPGAKQLMHTQMEAGESAAFTVTSSKEQVKAFYEEAMKKAGFEQQEPGVFRRRGEVITIYIQQQAGEIAVSLTRRMGVQ